MIGFINKVGLAKSNVVILAGGYGTRLKRKTQKMPKCLVEISKEKPIILHQILELKKYEFRNVLLLLHHQYEKIISYLGNGKKFGLNINYYIEKYPRGTGGAIYDARKYLDKDFLVIYGDLFFDIDLKKFIKFHKDNKSSITIFSHPNSHPHDSELLLTNKKNDVIDILRYKDTDNKIPNLASSGLFCFKKKVFDFNKFENGNIDLSKNIIKNSLKNNFKVKSYKSVEYIKDMGTLDRLKKVKKDVFVGKNKFLSNKKKRKAIFFDRDGTIIKECGHINKKKKILILKGVEGAIKKINDSGYLSIMITNQPVVARGELTESGLIEIHNFLERKFGEKGSYIDDIYYCPHHPHKGFKGEVKSLKKNCFCRKPKINLILNAVKKYNIDIKKSWFIGDTTTDMLTAKKSNLKSILVGTGFGGKDKKFCIKSDFKAKNFAKAINLILTK